MCVYMALMHHSLLTNDVKMSASLAFGQVVSLSPPLVRLGVLSELIEQNSVCVCVFESTSKIYASQNQTPGVSITVVHSS